MRLAMGFESSVASWASSAAKAGADRHIRKRARIDLRIRNSRSWKLDEHGHKGGDADQHQHDGREQSGRPLGGRIHAGDAAELWAPQILESAVVLQGRDDEAAQA